MIVVRESNGHEGSATLSGHSPDRRGHSADYPILVSMPETQYLKCFMVQVL